MRSKARSSLSWLLSLLMVFSMMPVMGMTSYADNTISGLSMVITVNDEVVTPTDGVVNVVCTDIVQLSVSGTAGLTEPTYNWKKDDSTYGSEATYYVYTGEPTTSSGNVYQCVVSSGADEGATDSVRVVVNKKELEIRWKVNNTDSTTTTDPINYKYDGEPHAPTAVFDPNGLGYNWTAPVTISAGQATSDLPAGEPTEGKAVSPGVYVATASGDNFTASSFAAFYWPDENPTLTFTISHYVQVSPESLSGLTEGAIAGVSEQNRTLTCEVPTFSGTPTYQWYKSTEENFTPAAGNAISGAINASYVIPDDAAAGTTYYCCVATVDGSTVSSPKIPVWITPAPATAVSCSVEGLNGQSGAYGDVLVTVTADVTNAGTVVFDLYENQAAGTPNVLTASKLTPPSSVQMTESPAGTGHFTGTYMLPPGTYEHLFAKVFNNVGGEDSQPVFSTDSVGTTTVTINKRSLTIQPKPQIVPVGGSIASGPECVWAYNLMDGHRLTKVTLTTEQDMSSPTTAGRIMVQTDSPDWQIKDAAGNDVSLYYRVKASGEGTACLTVVNSQFTVSGKVYEHGTSSVGVGNATVTLEKGNTVYARTKSDASTGEYSLTVVEPGTYNLVAVSPDGTLTKTKMVTFSDDGTSVSDDQDIVMPEAGQSSTLNTDAADSFGLVVGGLDDVADNKNTSVTLTVTLENNKENMTQEEKDTFTTGVNAINALPEANGATGLQFVEMTLTDDATGATISNSPNLLHMRIPFDTSLPNIGIFRWHDADEDGVADPGEAELMDELTVTPTQTYTEGYVVGSETEQFVDVYASRFSTYAIAYDVVRSSNENNNNNNPAGGGGSGRTSGGIEASTPGQTTPVTTEPVVNPGTVVTVPSEGTAVTGFTDVDGGAYYAEPIRWAVSAGITTGKTATLFGPGDVCTRGQIVTFIWRAAGSPEPTVTSTGFTDISADAYYYKAVLWAVENGIAKGTSDTTFSPDKIVTRGEAMTFIYRAKGGALATAAAQFSDVDQNAFYADAVGWAAANGVTTGTGAATFSPDDNCTRGQIVTFLYRANN